MSGAHVKKGKPEPRCGDVLPTPSVRVRDGWAHYPICYEARGHSGLHTARGGGVSWSSPQPAAKALLREAGRAEIPTLHIT